MVHRCVVDNAPRLSSLVWLHSSSKLAGCSQFQRRIGSSHVRLRTMEQSGVSAVWLGHTA